MNHMTDHLLEAIKINYQRRKLYSSITSGRSNKISILMIGLEVLSLPTSMWLDSEGKKWQKLGIPLMAYEFIPMDQTPCFKNTFPFEIEKLDSLPPFEVNALIKLLTQEMKLRNYEQLIKLSDEKLRELAQWPHVHCMKRHILESLIRCANLTIMHLKRAQELTLIFDLKASHFLLDGHIKSLLGSHYIDKLAFPLQNKGVPIIFQDVPHVPALPEAYL